MTLSALVDTVARRGAFNPELPWRALGWVIRYLRPGDGWASVLMLALNLMVVVWSVEMADWAPTPNLVSLVLVAMLTGLVLSRIPFWGILVLPVGLVIGLGVIIRQLTSFQAPGIALADIHELLYRLDLWWDAARSGSISLDAVPFAFALMVITWLAGYLAAWVFFRHRNFWGVFILGGAGLLSNLTYLPPNASVYLALYLFTGLLLVARVRAVRRRQEWERRNFQFDSHLGWLSLSDSVLLAFVVLAVAFWVIPTGRALGPAHATYELLRTPMKGWEDDFNRLFAGLPARKAMPYRLWGDAMAFQGTINPTTTPVLQVNSPAPLYWKARSYGTYTSKGWVAEDTVYKPLDWKASYSEAQPYLSRGEVTYTVTPGYASRNLFMAGQAVASNLDSRIETYDSPRYTLDLSNPASLPAWPPRLALAAQGLARVAQSGDGATDIALSQSLPEEFRLVRADRAGGVVRKVTLAEVVPEQPDVLSLRLPKGTVGTGQSYQITSSVSFATPRELRRAGTDYPTWVLTRYTQLPPEVPQRVRDLGSQITGNARNPYDKVKAIEAYLSTFTYTLQVDPPPYNVDGVDHFLFTLRRGYSEYFASSTVVLSRSVGIPARLATGYTAGDQQDVDLYEVKDSHSHAWVEVFFPNYGWIPFEPTPGADLPGAFRPGLQGQGPGATAAANQGAQDIFCADEDGEECFPFPGFDAQFEPGGPGSFAARWGRAFPFLLGLALLGAVAAGLGWLGWRRYASPSPDPQVVFRNLSRLGALGALGPAAHQTPHQYGQRLEMAFPQQGGQLSIIVNAYVRSRYGRKELTDRERLELAQAWLGLRLPLLLHIVRRRTT
ncbi:MAG TPA: transglutaminase domain-containing protein [Dehalococcoidia bacterium]|nr:transglutaminase domain-containing protein [Dehalococcoidia bacterium]